MKDGIDIDALVTLYLHQTLSTHAEYTQIRDAIEALCDYIRLPVILTIERIAGNVVMDRSALQDYHGAARHDRPNTDLEVRPALETLNRMASVAGLSPVYPADLDQASNMELSEAVFKFVKELL